MCISHCNFCGVENYQQVGPLKQDALPVSHRKTSILLHKFHNSMHYNKIKDTTMNRKTINNMPDLA
jgi:hypothetical protein